MGDGKQTTDFNTEDNFANAIAIQKDGKIVIAGSAIARYNTDGSLDNTFSGGVIQPNNFYISQLAIQDDGKIVIAGYRIEDAYPYLFALSRYNTDGSLDNTFGENGEAYYPSPSTAFDGSYATSLAIQKDGKIVAAGGAYNFSPSNDDNTYIIVWYNTDGSPDNTFGYYGTVSNTSYSNYVAKAAAIQSDGTIVVVIESEGRRSDYAGLALISYDTNGTLVKDLRIGRGDYDYIDNPASVAVQNDDKIVAAGRSGNDFALIRFNKDLSLDSSFSGDGKQTTSAIQVNGGINSIAIANNKLYAVGSNASSGNYGVVASYLLNDDGQNNAPTVNLTIPYNTVKYTAPARIKLNAVVANVIGKITKVLFYNGTSRLHTEDVPPYGFLWTDVPEGNYTLTAKAFDDRGNVITSNAINVSVVEENVPPVVSIVNPVNDTTYTGPATIRLIANAKDPNERISKVEFYNGTTVIRTEYYYPYTYTWTNVQPGTYTVTAKAYDDKGLSTTSAPVTVTVNASSLPIVKSRPSVNNQPDVNGVLSMKLSPVPAGSTLQIYTQGLQLSKPSTISIISASGVLLKTIQSNTSNKVVRLDVSSLVSGVYTVKVVSGDRMVYKQFLKL